MVPAPLPTQERVGSPGAPACLGEDKAWQCWEAARPSLGRPDETQLTGPGLIYQIQGVGGGGKGASRASIL